jgi:membrane-associated phospholipid phosphatase
VEPAPLVRLTLAYTVLGLVLVLVSRHWKISVHCAGVAMAGTVLWRLHDAPLWLVLGLVTMAAARLVLRRHTPGQVVAGSLLGVLVAAAFAC